VAGGTSDVGTRGRTAHEDGAVSDDARIKNKEQMIFSFEMPDLKDGSPGLTFREGGHGRHGWTSLSDGSEGSILPASIDTNNNDDGWYILLKNDDADYKAEYCTTEPISYGGILYFATFREQKIQAGTTSLCDTGKIDGQSRLWALGMDTGAATRWGDGDSKSLKFDGIKITGFTQSLSGGTPAIVVTYEVMDVSSAESGINTNVSNEDNLSRVSGMDAMVIKTPSAGGGRTPVTSNDQVVDYWLLNN
jgi:hypothetical protein